MTKKIYTAPMAEAVNFDAEKSFAQTLTMSINRTISGNQQWTRDKDFSNWNPERGGWNSELWSMLNEEEEK